jgi:hypothetical protein
VTWRVNPEPSDETEKRALLAALDQALDEENGADPRASAWWRAGFDDLDGGLDEAQPTHRAALDAPTLRS